MSYQERISQLRVEVESFINRLFGEGFDHENEAAQVLGYIVNMAVRCNPRQPQHTVRKNIVSGAVGRYCTVWMTEETDERTGKTFNKIHIHGKGMP